MIIADIPIACGACVIQNNTIADIDNFIPRYHNITIRRGTGLNTITVYCNIRPRDRKIGSITNRTIQYRVEIITCCSGGIA